MTIPYLIFILLYMPIPFLFLQCLDIVGWVTRPVKTASIFLYSFYGYFTMNSYLTL